MADWQDDTNSSPVYALMREMADDIAPHLNGLPESHPDVHALRAECMEALRSGRRAAGARKGAETKAAREASTRGGELPKITEGSAKQTKWATEIRSKRMNSTLAFRSDADGKSSWKQTIDPRMDRLVQGRTMAKFWIDTRDMPLERMYALYLKKDG